MIEKIRLAVIILVALILFEFDNVNDELEGVESYENYKNKD